MGWDANVADEVERAMAHDKRAKQEHALEVRRARLRELYAAALSGMAAQHAVQPGLGGWGGAVKLAENALVLAQAALVVEETERDEVDTWIRQVVLGVTEIPDPAWTLACDRCHEAITELESAMLYWDHRAGRPLGPTLAHKGRCDPSSLTNSVELRMAYARRQQILRDEGWTEMQRARLIQIFAALGAVLRP